MTHPLEELAKHLADLRNQLDCIPVDSPYWGRQQQANASTFLYHADSLLRRSIPDCECGELVRKTVEKHGWCSIHKFDFRPGSKPPSYFIGTDSDEDGVCQTDLGKGPTLSAAVSAAKGTT